MKRKVLIAAVIAATVSAPAYALGIEDLAKVVLGGNSVLKKAQSDCGSQGQLSLGDIATLDSAVGAARSALVPERFTTLEAAANTDADTRSQSNTFCNETKTQKKGLLSKIKKAGKNILLGGLGL